MKDVIKATENLKRTTQHISDVFNHTASGTVTDPRSDIRVSLVGNTCGVLYHAINQTFGIMGEKVCKIEKYAGMHVHETLFRLKFSFAKLSVTLRILLVLI